MPADVNSDTPAKAGQKTIRTVDDGFAEFAESLAPKYSESAEAEANLTAIERLLKASFNMRYLAPYGSIGHGTHVNGCSASDCFAVIPTDRLFEDSLKSLNEVHAVLKNDFPDASIADGRPVIVIPFGDQLSDRHHIVPAFVQPAKDDHDIFAVPAPRGRWVRISPGAHSAWLNALDNDLNSNLKPFVRMVKAWSYFNEQPIWSYYLELCVADFFKSDAAIIYSTDLNNFFRYLKERQLAAFEDAAGCSEPVYGTSIAGKQRAIEAIDAAVEFSDQARACEHRGQVADSFYWWRKMFDWRFASW
ncbi:MAG: hypothetical protein MPJ78_05055 [Hyphomicrobiaceae bacterium]|nr:hypothetical protein [Hyphomicrobiaceae bacterium]